MHLTRFGFNVAVIGWLLPIVFADFYSNGIYTDWQSDLYYWKAMADMLIIAYAAYEAFSGEATASVATAQARKGDNHDDVVDFAQVHAFQYIYCAVLALYALANFVSLHAINKAATGLLATITLVWSFVSLLVFAVSALQFYRLKSGAIVALKKRVLQ